MKPMFLLFATLVLGSAQVSAQSNPPRCNVGADPVNRDRQPVAGEEVIINPTDKVITYKSGSGRNVTCTLPIGTLVVVDKATGVAKWVFGCGNDIVSPTDWKPKRIPGPSSSTTIIRGERGDSGARGERGPAGPQGPPGRDGRDADPVERGGDNTWKWIAGTAVVVGGALLLADKLGAFDDNDNDPDPVPTVRVCENTSAVNYGGTLPCRFPGPGGTTDSLVIDELPTCNGLCSGIRTSRIRDHIVPARSRPATGALFHVRPSNKEIRLGYGLSF